MESKKRKCIVCGKKHNNIPPTCSEECSNKYFGTNTDINNYRIIKTRFGYMVEIEVTKTKGMWWWKKEYKDWELVNKYGQAPLDPNYISVSGAPTNPLNKIRPPFKTKKRAKKFIKKINH